MSLNKAFTIPKQNKSYQLDEFNKEQKQERENTKKAYIIDDFIDDLTKIAQEITKSKEIQDEEDFENAKSQVKKVKHKSMVKMKEEENIKNMILMIAKRNISSIGVFIKLIDYMIVETQVNITMESIMTLYNEMCKNNDQKKYGITSDITILDDELLFTPQEIDFQSNVEKLENDMLSIVSDITMIGNHSYFNQYTQGIISDKGL